VSERQSEPSVLLIEDNDGDAYLVVKALSYCGHRMSIGRSSDGKEAKSMLEAVRDGNEARPALVLLDLKLPFISGLELLQFMRSDSALADLAVVVFTSSDEQKDIDAANEAGCNDYYVKPIDFSVFRSTLREICDKYLEPAQVAIA
jgi:CheY-like chemotaxis protein